MTYETELAEWVERVGKLTPAELREMADRAESHDLHYVNAHGLHGTVVLTPDQARRLLRYFQFWREVRKRKPDQVGEPG